MHGLRRQRHIRTQLDAGLEFPSPIMLVNGFIVLTGAGQLQVTGRRPDSLWADIFRLAGGHAGTDSIGNKALVTELVI